MDNGTGGRAYVMEDCVGDLRKIDLDLVVNCD